MIAGAAGVAGASRLRGRLKPAPTGGGTVRGLGALQDEVAVEVTVLAVGAEAGYFSEGEGNGGHKAVDLLVGGVMAEAVDPFGVLPAEQVIVGRQGRQAPGAPSCGRGRSGLGGDAVVVQKLPERHDSETAGLYQKRSLA